MEDLVRLTLTAAETGSVAQAAAAATSREEEDEQQKEKRMLLEMTDQNSSLGDLVSRQGVGPLRQLACRLCVLLQEERTRVQALTASAEENEMMRRAMNTRLG